MWGLWEIVSRRRGLYESVSGILELFSMLSSSYTVGLAVFCDVKFDSDFELDLYFGLTYFEMLKLVIPLALGVQSHLHLELPSVTTRDGKSTESCFPP